MPYIIQNREAIRAAPKEDQEAIRKKFYTLYSRETAYPLDPPEEEEKPTAEDSADASRDERGDPGPGDQDAPPDTTGKRKDKRNTEVAIACPFEDIRSVQEPKNDPERVYESFCREHCRNRCSTYINHVKASAG